MTMNGSFRTKPFPPIAECDPGVRVLEYKVLVLMPSIERTTAGGVHIIDKVADEHEFSLTAAMLVSVSPMAFKFADWPRDENGDLLHADMLPRLGDVLRIKQYAGGEWKGRDGRNYRIIEDKDVYGVEEPEEIVIAGSYIERRA